MSDVDVTVMDLDESGWLLDSHSGQPVTHHSLHAHFAKHLAPPPWATDLIVYVHGWQTPPASAERAAQRLLALTQQGFAENSTLYPALAEREFAPWCAVVRWPSSSPLSLAGYRRIRDRAHRMGAREGDGHAAHIIGSLLGYLDAERPDPAAAPVLANREGQYLHLVGHSFGCRLLCEAVQWAADTPFSDTLGWRTAPRASRPFTVDSMLLFQMAAGRDAFESRFSSLLAGNGREGAPLRGPVVATYSRHDRATGFWHLRAEHQPGIGHSGIGPAPAPMFTTQMLPSGTRYPLHTLDHRFVNVDASAHFIRGRRLNPAGAHSDHLRPESAHLLLTLADYAR